MDGVKETLDKESTLKQEEQTKQETCEKETDQKEICKEEKDSQEQPEISQKEVSDMEKIRRELEEMKNLAQRTQADFMNYKKRVEKEKKDISAFANEGIMIELLEVIDNFERALVSGKVEETQEDGSLSGFYKGVQMILKQLTDKLAKYGLAEIQAEGADFDPNFHHAVMQVEGEQPEKVAEILQKGYTLREKVIRPSMVKVTK